MSGAVGQLMAEAQKNLHPSISNVLLRMGLALMSTPANFGVALGRAGLETLDAVDKQKQQAKQDYIQALRLGAELQDKRNAYEHARAAMIMGGTEKMQTAQTKQLDTAQKAFDKAQVDFSKSPGVQQQTRLDQINQVRQQQGLAPINNAWDPNLPADQRSYVLENKLPTTGAAGSTTLQTQEIRAGRHPASKISERTARPEQDCNAAAGRAQPRRRSAGHSQSAEAKVDRRGND
jgi:hypothetical protein